MNFGEMLSLSACVTLIIIHEEAINMTTLNYLNEEIKEREG